MILFPFHHSDVINWRENFNRVAFDVVLFHLSVPIKQRLFSIAVAIMVITNTMSTTPITSTTSTTSPVTNESESTIPSSISLNPLRALSSTLSSSLLVPAFLFAESTNEKGLEAYVPKLYSVVCIGFDIFIFVVQ